MDYHKRIYTIGDVQIKTWVSDYPYPNEFGQFMWSAINLNNLKGAGGLVKNLDAAEIAVQEYLQELVEQSEV